MPNQHTASAPEQKAPKESRYPSGHPLAWPEPPADRRAIGILMYPAFPQTESGRHWRRLRNLTQEEFAWVSKTVEVETRRRMHRNEVAP